MNAKYTPGPLEVRMGANGDVGIIATSVQPHVLESERIGGALIAECYREIRREGENARIEAIANATLFAASHDMLAILQRLSAQMPSPEFMKRNGVHASEELLAIRAAIDKALRVAS